MSSKGQLSHSNLPAVPVYLSVLPEMISSSWCCSGVLRWPQVSLGVSCGTGQSEGLSSSRGCGILLGYGQQICLPGACGGKYKTWEGSDLPQSQSCSCPWLGCRGGWRCPLLLSPCLTSASLRAAFIPSTAAAAFLSSLGVGILNSSALTRCAWLCCSSTVVQLSWRCPSPREKLGRVNVLPAPGAYSPQSPLLLSHSQAQLQTRL